MSPLNTTTKLQDFIDKYVACEYENLRAQLVDGELREVEDVVHAFALKCFDVIMEDLMVAAAKQMEQRHREQYNNLETRPQTIQVRSGTKISINGCYRKRVTDNNPESQRKLLAQYWGLIRDASPGLYARTAQSAVLCPSYDQASQLMNDFGITCTVSSVQRLTNTVAETCHLYGEMNLQLEADESLANKRVVISSDGGRSRLREYNGSRNEEGRAQYDTPYREPKLFVIEVLNDQGRQSQHHLPIYGCRFDKDEHVELVRSYLKKLKIDQAAEVQLICDGAVWIWNAFPKMLKELGVEQEKMTLTLDYYHATQHLNKLCEQLPSRIGKKRQKVLFKRFKEWLWQGKVHYVIRYFNRLYRRIPSSIKTELNYFKRHQNHTQYRDYESRKLLCGSGLVESAIRRIVNLRFKNSSTFWLKENVEKLFFIRGAVLSKRWNIVTDNLAKRYNLVGQN